jgi:hypothetical protein
VFPPCGKVLLPTLLPEGIFCDAEVFGKVLDVPVLLVLGDM